MIELVVGLVAGLLLLVGLLIIAGPALRRPLDLALRRTRVGLRAAWPPARPRRPGAPVEVHPTTGRALAIAGRLEDLLSDHGQQRQAGQLRSAVRRLQVEEAGGIYAMLQVHRHLRAVRLADRADQEILEGLLGQLRKALNDRAEQLELLPRS